MQWLLHFPANAFSRIPSSRFYYILSFPLLRPSLRPLWFLLWMAIGAAWMTILYPVFSHLWQCYTHLPKPPRTHRPERVHRCPGNEPSGVPTGNLMKDRLRWCSATPAGELLQLCVPALESRILLVSGYSFDLAQSSPLVSAMSTSLRTHSHPSLYAFTSF